MSLQILCGDWVEQLRTLPDQSVHCCVTSPPYWGLRDYGVAGQLGLEKTPGEYIEKVVAGFREVWRVLRDDGTLWLNLGDCYSASNRGSGGHNPKQDSNRGSWTPGNHRGEMEPGAKPKDLCGIPWRVAFALQADGWYLRCDIIWHKPNPMPESVMDRPTKAHEYIFLLSKKPRYFYDAEAVKEPQSQTTFDRFGNGGVIKRTNTKAGEELAGEVRGNITFKTPTAILPNGRNRRSVWTVPSQAYPESHFATFPEDLVKPCILAGTSARGCCAKCGSPWERIVEEVPPPPCHRNPSRPRQPGNDQMAAGVRANGDNWNGPELASWKSEHPGKTTWEPTCKCGCPDTVPATVLDPFAGSFTTCQVALELGRSAIGIELSREYVALGRQRCAVTPGLAIA